MKPKIGITCQFNTHAPPEELRTWEHLRDWNTLPSTYIYAVEEAGGIPIPLPIFKHFDTLNTLITDLDGFLFTGGSDVNPRLYNQRVKEHSKMISPLRDNRELALAKVLLDEVPKPILGIGRGMHLINVARGGTLYQDIAEDGGYHHHMCTHIPPQIPCHSVTLDPHSKLARIYGCYHLEVNSAHHQGICLPGKQVEITAHSVDGAIEALEIMDHPFAIGVQWHPETMLDSPVHQKLFYAFSKACSS